MILSKKIDVKRALRVFQYIRESGQVCEGGRVYEGVVASTDFDGYTVFLRTDKVDLSIFFHNKYQLKYRHRYALADFQERLKRIERQID